MIVANEILDANLGTLMPDGQRFTNPAYIEPGWVLILPGTMPTTAAPVGPAEPSTQPRGPSEEAAYVVESGDTLWKIADTELGSGTRWAEIWEENAGDEMVGGRTFDDPNLILPGWELDLPADGATGVESTATAEPPTVDAGDTLAPNIATAAPSDGEDASTAASSIPTDSGSSTSAASTAELAPVPAPAETTTIAPGLRLPRRPAGAAAAPIAEAPPSNAPASTVATTTTTTVLAGGSGEQLPMPRPIGALRPMRRRRSGSNTPRCWPPASSPWSASVAGNGCAPHGRGVGSPSRDRRSWRPNCCCAGSTPASAATRIDVACRAAAFELIDTDVQIVVVQVSTEGEIVLTLSR